MEAKRHERLDFAVLQPLLTGGSLRRQLMMYRRPGRP
jgi:hypothetical protein